MNLEEKLKKQQYKEIWQQYCGFLDLSMDGYMKIQRRLMEEQIRLWSNCGLGQSILKGKHPTNEISALPASTSVFHVEHEFLPVWRRYARALKQRNILLRHRHGLEQLDAWEQELAQAGTAITQMRSACSAPNSCTRPGRPWPSGPSIRKSAAGSPGPVSLGRMPQ